MSVFNREAQKIQEVSCGGGTWGLTYLENIEKNSQFTFTVQTGFWWQARHESSSLLSSQANVSTLEVSSRWGPLVIHFI